MVWWKEGSSTMNLILKFLLWVNRKNFQRLAEVLRELAKYDRKGKPT